MHNFSPISHSQCFSALPYINSMSSLDVKSQVVAVDTAVDEISMKTDADYDI